MRLLVDANLSPRVARHLHAAGHDALHVADVDLLTAADLAIAEFAATDERVVVTSDSDFGSILARTGSRVPSLVLFRHHNGATPDRQLELIEAALAAVPTTSTTERSSRSAVAASASGGFPSPDPGT